MKLLAIETSSEACSVALYLNGEVIEDYRLAPRQHGKLILQMVESVMAASNLKLADLDALAFGRGPGSFTGLRIAAGVIQGLAFGAELPVLPISTLAAISLQAQDEFGGDYFFPAFDARLDEVYWGVYQSSDSAFVIPIVAEQVCSAEAVTVPEGISGIAIGSGWASHQELLLKRVGNKQVTQTVVDYLPRAGAIARLAVIDFEKGRAVSAEQAQPIYLRDKVAKTKIEQQADREQR